MVSVITERYLGISRLIIRAANHHDVHAVIHQLEGCLFPMHISMLTG
jgi:hypothetical protein